LDGLLALVISRAEASPGTLAKALGRVTNLMQLARRYDRQERARTTQSRVQFWLVAALVPGLVLSHALLLPDLFLQTVVSASGRVGYVVALFLLSVAFWLFYRMQGQSFGFLQRADAKPLSRRPPLGSHWLLHRDDPLKRHTLGLGFWGSVEVALLSGHSLKDSLVSATRIFPETDLATCCEPVLELESKGVTLTEAFEQLADRKDASAKQILQLARGAKDRTLLVETAQVLVDRAREQLGDVAEERLGSVGVQLLVPLCCGLLPAAVAVLVAPILHVLQVILGHEA
jgi:Flp pilus assembly protein TadB